MRFFAFILTICLPFLPVQASFLHTQTFQLPNGLSVALVENHGAPVVTISLVYKIGTADDGKGLAHFLEHVMFRGTEKFPQNQFKQFVLERGGNTGAYTTPDITVYHTTIASQHLGAILHMEADRMLNLTFTGTKAEQEIVLRERQMRMENDPFARAYEILNHTLYRGHPYSIPAIGYTHHIQSYTKSEAQRFYKHYYHPNNALLIVIGDVDLPKLISLVTQEFGQLKSPPQAQTRPVRPPIQKSEGTFIDIRHKEERVEVTTLSWHYWAPSFQGEGSQHFFPLIYLEKILGGGVLSRLYRLLVEEKKLATHVQCDYEGITQDPRLFSIYATLAPGAQQEDLRQAVEEEIKTLFQKGVTSQEIEDARQAFLSGLAFMHDGHEAALSMLIKLAYGVSLETVESWVDHLKKVTQQQVQEAAHFVFTKGPAVRLRVSPSSQKKLSSSSAQPSLVPEKALH